MTMKNRKTLAAVAVVLLALALVFVAPVSADDIKLTVANAGNSASPTTFYVNGDQTVSYTLYQILWNSSENYDDANHYNNPSTLLKDGDRIILPSGIINVTQSHEQYRIYGNVTIEGAADGSTIFYVHSTKNYRVFQIYSRYDLNTESNVVLKNFTVEGNNGIDRSGTINRHGIVLTSYLIDLQVENVIFKNLTGHVFSAWAQQSFVNGNNYPTIDDDVGVTITLKNVVTENNGALVHFDVAPYNSGSEASPAYGFVHLKYDETSTFNDKNDGNLVYSEEGLGEITYNYKPNCVLFQGNMRINDNNDITLGSAVAQIGDDYYVTLAEAVKNANADDTITLLKDVEIDSLVTISKSLTIDGGEDMNVITGPESNSALYLKGEEGLVVTLKNLMVEGKYAVKVGSPKTTLNVDNALLYGYAAVYLRSYDVDNADGSKVTITNSALVSLNENNAPTNDFGTIVVLANNTEVSVQNTDLYAIATGTANQSILRFGADSVSSPFENAKVTIGGNSVLEVDNANFMSVGTGSDFTGISQQIIGEGVTANFNPSAYIAQGMEVVQPGDKYLVQKYVDRSSSSSSSSTTEPEEPEQPEEPVVEPETPAAPGEVTSSTEVTDGGEVAFETTVVDEETGEPSAPAAADSEIKGVVLPDGTEGTVEFIPVSEQPAPAGQEENTKRVFEINVPQYEEGKAAVIKFQMTVEEIAADGKTAADVTLWHFDEETGEWTKLTVTYTIVDGIVYFEAITFDFSPFAIVYADEPVDEPIDEPVDEPETPAPVLGLLAALGAAVVLRRK